MFKVKNLILTVLVSATLVACGGGDTSAPSVAMIATSDISSSITASTAAALVNEPFTFPAGVPDFGTTTATDVAFTSTSATPAFVISSAGATATGITTFGSCIFTVTASTFPAGSKLAVGQSVRVNPCQINVGTAGNKADGSSNNRLVKFVLGTLNSNGKNLAVVINADGSVVVKGVTIGTVTIAAVTGT